MLKARKKPLKKFDVTLTAHYEKTISVYAQTPEQAKEKIEIILFDTDLVDFSDDDFIGGEAAITCPCEDGLEDAVENETSEDDCCSGCPYFCPVCGECMYENECDE